MILRHPIDEGSHVLLKQGTRASGPLPDKEAVVVQSLYELAGSYVVRVEPESEDDNGIRLVDYREITHQRSWLIVQV